jgi:hypothetical protein
MFTVLIIFHSLRRLTIPYLVLCLSITFNYKLQSNEKTMFTFAESILGNPDWGVDTDDYSDRSGAERVQHRLSAVWHTVNGLYF